VKVGIVIPMPQEVKPLTRTKLRIGEPFWLCEQICLIRSGVGEQHVLHAAKVILRQQIEALISWGTCVSLVPELKTGDLILPSEVLDHNGRIYPTDRYLYGRLKSHMTAEHPINEGNLHGVSHIIADPAQKLLLARTTGAIAADMESHILARIACDHQLAFAAIRAVSDTTTMQIPDAIVHGVNSYGEVQWKSFMYHLIRRPDQYKSMASLVRGLWRAQATLGLAGKYLPDVFS